MRLATMIDIPAAGGVEAGRLERGLELEVRPLEPGRYHVSGGREQHWVDLRSPLVPRCDCGDHLWRERVCKHILAALLREGDERVIREVAALVAGLRAQVRSLAVRPRPRRGRGRVDPAGAAGRIETVRRS
ncbi:MAG: hypothetical protein JWM27_438 [Gemmatimonadetes bacterium]|nr:hypothetical protein [Gemmatimonadota bacterium]